MEVQNLLIMELWDVFCLKYFLHESISFRFPLDAAGSNIILVSRLDIF